MQSNAEERKADGKIPSLGARVPQKDQDEAEMAKKAIMDARRSATSEVKEFVASFAMATTMSTGVRLVQRKRKNGQ